MRKRSHCYNLALPQSRPEIMLVGRDFIESGLPGSRSEGQREGMSVQDVLGRSSLSVTDAHFTVTF